MTPLGPLVITTASTEEPVARNEAKLWLRIEEEEVGEDGLIDDLILMAWKRYEEYTGRALLEQSYDYYLPDFPAGAIELPRWPLVSIDEVRGLTDTDVTDTGGTSMSSSEYYVDTAREPGRVVPFSEYSWPTATRITNAAIVSFTAGETTETTGVPEHAQVTLKAMIAHAYEHRGDQTVTELAPLMDEILRNELTIQDWG